jgi:hypothetical protein
MQMKIARFMLFVLFAALCSVVTLTTAAEPAPASSAAPIPRVVITAKRLTPAEIARVDREEARQKEKALAAEKVKPGSGKRPGNLG